MARDVLVSAGQLTTALKAIGGIVQHKSSLVCCRGVRLTAHAGVLTLTTTDLTTQLETQILAHGWEFDTVVEHAALVRAIGSGSDDRVMLAHTGEQGLGQFTVAQGKRTISLTAHDAECFPERRTIEGVCIGALSGEQLERLKVGVVEAAAKDDSRPILAGVSLAWGDGVLTASAADGFRLGIMRVKTAGDHEGTTGSIVVPAAILRLVGSVNGSGLDLTGYTVEQSESAERTDATGVMFDRRWLRLQWRAGTKKLAVIVTAITEGIQGKYPDLARVVPDLPADGGYAVTLAADVIEDARRLKVENQRLAFADGYAVARLADGAAVAWQGGALVAAPLSADGTQVAGALNVEYLGWCLRALNTRELAFCAERLEAAHRAGDDDLTLVIMPMTGSAADIFALAGLDHVAAAIEAAAERAAVLKREREAARIEQEIEDHERAVAA